MADAGNGDADLPEGWASVPLGALVQPSKDRIEPAECVNTPYLSLEHIESGTGRIIGKGVGADVASTKAVFHAGDVLYGKLRPYLNKVYVAEFDGICSTDILVFPKNDLIENRLLRHFLSTPAVVEFANHHSAGVQLPRVSFSSLATLAVPLPPMSEQRRIVAKVETLLARVQAVRERLARVPLILKRFRQSILAAACDGRLTSDWREASNSVSAHASDENIAGLPSTWVLATIDDVSTKVVDCPHSTPQWTADGEICLRTTNFRVGILDLTEVRYVASETYNQRVSRLTPQAGDVLYSREGGILGIACLMPPGIRACLGQRMMLMRIDNTRCIPAFVTHVLNSPSTTAIVREMTGGTASPHLNVGDIKAFAVPVPPLIEQQEIVRRVDSLFKLANAIERHVVVASARAEKLTQSILGKAFRGELVPTEVELAEAEGRDYESAEQLLARLRSVHSVESTPPSRRRKPVAPPDSGAQRQRLKRGQDVLDVLLLLDAWKKPVSIHVLDPALLLLRNDAARKTLLRGIATPRQRRTLKESPQFIVGLDLLCATLAGRGVIERVGDSAWKLLKPDLIKTATTADRKKVAAVVRAIEALNDVRSLPAIVAELTHERYEVTV